MIGIVPNLNKASRCIQYRPAQFLEPPPFLSRPHIKNRMRPDDRPDRPPFADLVCPFVGQRQNLPQRFGEHHVVDPVEPVWAHFSGQQFSDDRQVAFAGDFAPEQLGELLAVIGISEGMGDNDLADD